jgi:hypothetical protein
MVGSKFIFVIVLVFGLGFSLPVERRRTNGMADEPERFRRRVGNLNITSTLEQYVHDLYEEYASESGKLRYGADKPTDVWCFPDKGELLFSLLSLLASFYIPFIGLQKY